MKIAFVLMLASVLSVLRAGAAVADGIDYRSLFISAEWAAKAGFGDALLIDTRPAALYRGQQGHIPGAVNAEWTYFANMDGKAGDPSYGEALDPVSMAGKMGKLGISGDRDVVVYGDGGDWGNAGWVVWILRMHGVRNSWILDGGFTLYRASGGRTSGDTVSPKPVHFAGAARRDESYISDTAWMKKNYTDPAVKIVDVRGPDEYTGLIRPFGERRPGHIPGAINIPLDSVYTADFKVIPEADLSALFENAGLTDREQIIVCYDTSGVRAAFMTMALRFAGYANARCYNPSFQAWSADADAQVTQGPAPM